MSLPEVKGNGESLTPDQRITRAIFKTPSFPTFEQSTIGYCDDAIEAIGLKLKSVLLRQFAFAADLIDQRVQALSHPQIHALHRSAFGIENSQIFIETPNGKKMPANRVAEAVYHANPELGLWEYIIPLYLPPPGNRLPERRNYVRFNDDRSRKPHEEFQRYPWFTNRIGRVVEVGELPLNSPVVEIMGVGYVTQIAKNLAVNRTQSLLKRLQNFGGLDTADRIPEYFDRLDQSTAPIRRDQRYIAKGLDTIEALKEGAGLEEDHIQIALDLAFLKNRAFDDSEEFQQVMAPLIRFVAAGDWDQAFTHRDFLLRYFTNSFPTWRVRRFQRETGVSSYESFKDLARAIVQGRLDLTGVEIPDAYQPIFEDILPKKINRAQHERERGIITRSLGLSNAIIKELAKKARKSVQERIQEVFGEDAPYAIDLLTDEFEDQSETVEAYGMFFDMYKTVNSKATRKEATEFFKQLRKDLLREERRAEEEPASIINTPVRKDILEVELFGNKQQYWYKTNEPIEVADKDGNVELRWRNHANFGRLLYQVILAGFNQNPDRPIIPADQVAIALRNAYESQNRKDPYVSLFGLSEYVMVTISSAGINLIPEEEGLVVDFIKTL